MFVFTRQEKRVLWFIAGVIFCGAVLRYFQVTAKLEAASQAVFSQPLSLPAVININNATFEDLQSLPGIGPEMANRILDFREQGKFSCPDDLKKVKGIGDKKAKLLEPRITFK